MWYKSVDKTLEWDLSIKAIDQKYYQRADNSNSESVEFHQDKTYHSTLNILWQPIDYNIFGLRKLWPAKYVLLKIYTIQTFTD